MCAGLRGKYEKEELVGRSIVLLLNLKPVEFKGVKSEGMMLVGDQQKPQKLQVHLEASEAPSAIWSIACANMAIFKAKCCPLGRADVAIS